MNEMLHKKDIEHSVNLKKSVSIGVKRVTEKLRQKHKMKMILHHVYIIL